MQLSLITRAVLAGALAAPALAQAQSSVQLGGNLKIGADRVSYSGGVGGSGPSATRITDNSSYWFVKGEEDLGGGTKAVFHWETAFNLDTGAAGTGRFSAVGLQNPAWGRLLLGQWSVYFAADQLLTPEGIANATPYSTGTLNVLGSIGKRSQYFAGGFLANTIRYDSPRWSGFGFAASYGFDTETPNQSGNRTLNFNPTYIDGPLAVYANFLSRKKQPGSETNFTTTFDQDAMRLGAAWRMGNGIKLAALWDRNKVEGTAIPGGRIERDAWALPLSWTQGPHLVSFTYGKARPYETAGKKANDTGATMTALSYQYALSKRTFLATSYATMRNERLAAYDFWHPSNTLTLPATYTGFRSQYLYAGVKHVF